MDYFRSKKRGFLAVSSGDNLNVFGKRKKPVVPVARESSSSKESEDDQSSSELSNNSSTETGSSCDDINKASRKQKSFAKRSIRQDKKREKEHRKKHEKNHICMDDFLSKQSEFKMWLFEEKCKCFSELSSPKLKSNFKMFMKLWNKKKLPQKYYRGSEESVESPAPSSSVLTFSFSDDFDKIEKTSFRRPKSKRLSVENSNSLDSPFATFGKTPPKVLHCKNLQLLDYRKTETSVLNVVKENVTTPEHQETKSDSSTTLVLGEYQVPKRLLCTTEEKENASQTPGKVAPYLITTYPWLAGDGEDSDIKHQLSTDDENTEICSVQTESQEMDNTEKDVISPVYAVPIKEKGRNKVKHIIENKNIGSPLPPPVPPPPAPDVMYDVGHDNSEYKAVLDQREQSPPLPPMPQVVPIEDDVDDSDIELPPPPPEDDLIYDECCIEENRESLTETTESDVKMDTTTKQSELKYSQPLYTEVSIASHKHEEFDDKVHADIVRISYETEHSNVSDYSEVKVTNSSLVPDSNKATSSFSSFGYQSYQSPAVTRRKPIVGLSAKKKGFASTEDILSLYTTRQERIYDEVPDCSCTNHASTLPVTRFPVAKSLSTFMSLKSDFNTEYASLDEIDTTNTQHSEINKDMGFLYQNKERVGSFQQKFGNLDGDTNMMNDQNMDDVKNSSLKFEKYLIPKRDNNKKQDVEILEAQNVSKKRKHLSGDTAVPTKKEEFRNKQSLVNEGNVNQDNKMPAHGILKQRHKSCDQLDGKENSKKKFLKQKSLDELDTQSLKLKKIRPDRTLSVFSDSAKMYLETDIDSVENDGRLDRRDKPLSNLQRSKSMETMIW